MVNELPDMTLKAIGVVRNKVSKTPKHGYDWRGIVSDIEIDSRLSEALDNLDKFSHVIILYWMHRLSETDRHLLRAHPMGERSREVRGVFALRSPMRPNPIGSTVVDLVEVRGEVLLVRGLDALDGSPVVDIKIAR